jgi:DNA adenine methylase
MATPFLKWAGGKGRLVAAILDAAPEQFATYHEPFLGAGAVFFGMAAAGRFERAVINDSNAELMDTFRQVRDDVAGVTGALELLAAAYLGSGLDARAQIYYSIRASRPETRAARAARTIFLNKTCYNGLYRVNRKGEFNVPHGDYTRPAILDPKLLCGASAALQCADLRCEDFETACGAAQPGDFVYLDPPYHPLSATSSFTSYTHAAFGAPEQERLRDVFLDLTGRGVAALLSNSDHPFVRELYEGHGLELRCVSMSRAINSVGSKRAPISELLISNAQLVTDSAER